MTKISVEEVVEATGLTSEDAERCLKSCIENNLRVMEYAWDDIQDLEKGGVVMEYHTLTCGCCQDIEAYHIYGPKGYIEFPILKY